MIIKKNVKRLLLYRLCLIKFREMGLKKVYSYSLGKEAGITAEQVRKDFSHFGIRGKKKGGYDVDDLIDRMNIIFQRNELQKVIIIGIGNIGRALSHYVCGFGERRQYIIAGFDIDPVKTRKTFDIPVYPNNMLEEFIKSNKVKIAIISVPAISAQEVCNRLVHAGIKGIMNFAPVILQVPKDVIVNNINLCDELESVIYTAVSETT